MKTSALESVTVKVSVISSEAPASSRAEIMSEYSPAAAPSVLTVKSAEISLLTYSTLIPDSLSSSPEITQSHETTFLLAVTVKFAVSLSANSNFSISEESANVTPEGSSGLLPPPPDVVTFTVIVT